MCANRLMPAYFGVLVILVAGEGMCAPADNESQDQFVEARTAADNKEYGRARELLEQLMLEHPDNVDYLLAYAQAHYWAGNEADALRFAQQARELAPDYEDIWNLEFQIRRALAESGTGPNIKPFLVQAEARFPASEWYRAPIDHPDHGYEWEITASRHRLDNGSDDWHQLNASLARRVSNGANIRGLLGRYTRFGETDHQFGIRVAVPFATLWSIELGFRSSSSPAFLARNDFDLAISRQLGNGWVASGTLRQREYAAASVSSLGAMTEKYVGKYRFAYALNGSRLTSKHALVHSVSANVYADSGWRVGINLAAGQEMEVVELGQLVKTDIDSIVLSGRHPVGGSLQIGWQLGTHRQGDLYRRNFVGVSVSGAY